MKKRQPRHMMVKFPQLLRKDLPAQSVGNQAGDDTVMLLKAADDFKRYSLKSLPTLVQKLAYISSLQNKAGYYTHWGLTRVFGDQKAQKAILTVHSELALDVLRRPIRDLYQETRSAEERRPELVTETPFKLSAPANDDVLLSAHLQLIQESLVAVNGQPATHQPAA